MKVAVGKFLTTKEELFNFCGGGEMETAWKGEVEKIIQYV